MHKFILIMVLAVLSGNAMAEWVLVGSNDTFTVYANPSSIRKNGNIVRMWSMYDQKQLQHIEQGPFMSMVGQSEYDCKEEQVRSIAYSGYSENMGRGRPNFSSVETLDWSPIIPSTTNNKLWNVACGRG